MKMRLRAFSANVSTNILLQVVTILCGLIVPRLIIGTYGSEVNGMIASITQFLGYITLLEAGVGSVVKASLYKPLSNKCWDELSGILKATKQFFQKIAYIFVAYLLILAATYKYIAGTNYSWLFSSTLVVILGISVFVQYYFGITYQIMLQADQKYWITSGLQIITLLLNTILTVVLVKCGCSIHAVKIASAIVFMIRPFCYNIYVQRKYNINSSIKANNEALSQRWDGLGHHIAYFIHTNTDVVLLTIFLNVTEVSVYSVYFMVVNGVKSLVNSVAAAIEPYFGKMLVSDDKEKVQSAFSLYETLNYILITIVFTTTALLIVPFINIYTEGVTDANYIRPLFGIVITAAEGAYSLRNPYSSIIFASGHFKQTRNGAFLEALVNIIVSLILLKPLGILGVAIGTLISMLLRTFQYIHYLSRNILNRSLSYALKNMLLMIGCIIIGVFTTSFFKFEADTYYSWTLLALITMVIITIETCTIYLIFNRKMLTQVYSILKNKNY